MTEELIRFCAPTLAALKTAGAFGYPFVSEHALKEEIFRLNSVLERKGVYVLPLQASGNRALIYAFRPSMLERDLSLDIAKGVLSAYKYPNKNVPSQLLHLSWRLERGNRFPHEMGLFLGYPPLDVLGFILNNGTRYKRAGLWKVYSNEAEAIRRFSLYKSCTERFLHRYYNGEGIEDIAVFL